ncbi:FAST kinase domain-containing protein 3, mitochondrial [Rhinatrema bivittatum]|uniref:FAST kinase domain-containing protein 3, mitochondrial n=1 Tax=Rhinatrema bivittatum TaxID=194408 RepID=UPI00112B3FA6|nr:FAST kinase domain-containing protein 3, mitochondrial [Rhinatrema bivittatum]XP_029445883.1 FAST kinase domain-containing protein 3, mitochondrial [Rhinatrema bivittatum]XP_029445884.1 FAST kinase domain-containing protein 3, mitochondrial [Rhinatrema bivittatum]
MLNMALVNWQGLQFYTRHMLRVCRSTVKLRKALNCATTYRKTLSSWHSGALVLHAGYTNGKLLPLSCRCYHSTIWSQPDIVTGGTVRHHGDAGSGLGLKKARVDEKQFAEQLSCHKSSSDVFKLVASLEVLSDLIVALALQRISQIEVQEDGSLMKPIEIFENEVFKALCFQFEQDSQKVSTASLVRVLRALVQLCVDPWSTLMVRLVSESQERLDKEHMSIVDLCILGESMLDLEGPGCAVLQQIMEQVQEKKLEDWTPEEIAMVYKLLQWGVGEGGQYQGLLNRMNGFTLSIAPKLSSELLSTVLHALVVLNQTQATSLVIRLCKQSVRHLPHFMDDELGNVLGALMHFGHSDRYFTEALERHVAKASFTMHPEVVSKAIQYCSRRQILSRPIFDAIAESFVYNADKFTTSQVARQIMPFGKLNYLPPNATALFRKLENVLNNRFSQFQPRTLLNLLHSCTLIQRFPVNFLAKVFSPYFLQQLQAQEKGMDKFLLSQLTQLFLTVRLECPFYEGPRLLPKYRVKTFLTPGRSLETPLDTHLFNRVKTGLIELLGARMYFASHVLTPYCYTLDVEIKLDEEGFVLSANRHEEVFKRIALCIDGPKRFCANSHNLLGKEAIKQRQLRLLGYEIVQIPYFEFEALQSSDDIVAYLHKKIFPYTFRLSW